MSTTDNLIDRAERIAAAAAEEFEAAIRDKILEIYPLAIKHHKVPVIFRFSLETMDAGFVRIVKPRLVAKVPEGVATEGEDREFDFNTPDMFEASPKVEGFKIAKSLGKETGIKN